MTSFCLSGTHLNTHVFLGSWPLGTHTVLSCFLARVQTKYGQGPKCEALGKEEWSGDVVLCGDVNESRVCVYSGPVDT